MKYLIKIVNLQVAKAVPPKGWACWHNSKISELEQYYKN